MPYLKIYDLFISHAWSYDDDYKRLVKLLDGTKNFKYCNYSVPGYDPTIDPTTKVGRLKLENALDDQIRPVHCILVIAVMNASYKYWIRKELELAQKYRKPILGLVPRGHDRTPAEVKLAARKLLPWNAASIVSAIRQYAI